MKRIIYLLLLVLLSSCAAPTQSVKTEDSTIIGGIKPVIQDDNGCLPACLEMVLRYYGVDLNKRQIADQIGQLKLYSTWDKVPALLGKYGLCVKTIQDSEAKSYIEQGIPLIARGKKFGMGSITHVVVVVGYNGSGWYIIDPYQAAGMVVMNRYQFEEWHKGHPIFAIKRL